MFKARFATLLCLPLFLGGCTLDGAILNLLSKSEPTITLASNIIVYSQNESAMQLSGTCSPDGLTFKIQTPAISPLITCEDGEWSQMMDLSTLSEGTQQVVVNIESNAQEVELPIFKDTTPPTGVSFQLQSGASLTSSLSVSTDITGTDITDVYLTESSGCLSGGLWQTQAAVTSWLLSMGDGTKTVYFKSRDEYGNESACISDSIVLDTTAPVLALSYSGGSTFYTSSFVLTITPSEPVTGLSLGDFTTTNANLSGFTDNAGSYSLTVTPIAYGTVEVSLSASVVQDSAGLQNALTTASRTYSTVPVGYIPTPKKNDSFAVAYSDTVRICQMSSITSCVALPAYVDSNSVTVTLREAKLLLNGNIIAVGHVNDGGVNKAITALYNVGSGTWSELDRFSFEPTKSTEAYALAVSPLGSVAVAISARNVSNTMHFITRELIAGSGSWQTSDVFNIGGVVGTPTSAAYMSDESLLIAGTLYTSTPTGTGIIRKKNGTNQTWSTLDQYIHSSLETKYVGMDIQDDKAFLVGWVGYGTRNLIIRDCVISTASCATRTVTPIAGDTYGHKIATDDGNTLILVGSNNGGPSGSTQYFQASYVISTNTLTINQNYQVSSANAAYPIAVGVASDGRFWGYGRGFNGAVQQQFLAFYTSIGSPISAYNY